MFSAGAERVKLYCCCIVPSPSHFPSACRQSNDNKCDTVFIIESFSNSANYRLFASNELFCYLFPSNQTCVILLAKTALKGLSHWDMNEGGKGWGGRWLWCEGRPQSPMFPLIPVHMSSALKFPVRNERKGVTFLPAH